MGPGISEKELYQIVVLDSWCLSWILFDIQEEIILCLFLCYVWFYDVKRVQRDFKYAIQDILDCKGGAGEPRDGDNTEKEVG